MRTATVSHGSVSTLGSWVEGLGAGTSLTAIVYQPLTTLTSCESHRTSQSLFLQVRPRPVRRGPCQRPRESAGRELA